LLYQRVFGKIVETEKSDIPKTKNLHRSSLVQDIPEFAAASKVIIMNDEYSARDLNFDKFRDLYKRELQGPSLKELDVIKRIAAIHAQGIPNNKDREQFRKNKRNEENQALLEKKKEKDKFLGFLLQDTEHRLKLKTELNVKTVELNKKLGKLKQNEMFLLNLNDSEFPTSLNGSFRKSVLSRDATPMSNLKMKRDSSLNLNRQNSSITMNEQGKHLKSEFDESKINHYSRDSIKFGTDTVNNLDLLLASSPTSKSRVSIASSSTVNLNHRIKPSKSYQGVELVHYYQQKQNSSPVPERSSMTSSILTNVPKIQNTRHSKIQKDPLHFILNKLNQDVKKAQVKGYIKKNLTVLESKTPSKSYDKLPTHISVIEEASSNNIPLRKEGEKSEDFLKELRQLKKLTHDSWNNILTKPTSHSKI